ncbi:MULTISPECIES: hypothetical protein [Halorussus]|uniref:hypothetical protein n=1 Tax=Halorussus TaxID=1070314 RepID=UPI00209EE56C|nr:hypothetical protein [Halorussus vallis]USZ77505.1 hypothetical protein NGM07_09255 [Halorussus vallis]
MTYRTPEIDSEERRRFLKVLGATSAVAAGTELTVDELRNAMEAGTEAELAAMGQAIRSDLTGRLDPGLLGTELANVAASAERLPELRAAGIPARDSTTYRELAEPVRRVYEHLGAVGFFESAETHLPAFTEDHIESTARELVRAEPLTALLSEAGFDEKEKTLLVANVANRRERLALWVPTKDIPEEVEYDLEHVAPLHQRALGGAMLWIEDLDDHLWQKEYLITDRLLDEGFWDLKVMLGGAQLLTKAAHDVAGAAELTDSQLTAALTAGTASAILGQEDLTDDMHRITDDVRAPSEVR